VVLAEKIFLVIFETCSAVSLNFQIVFSIYWCYLACIDFSVFGPPDSWSTCGFFVAAFFIHILWNNPRGTFAYLNIKRGTFAYLHIKSVKNVYSHTEVLDELLFAIRCHLALIRAFLKRSKSDRSLVLKRRHM